MPTPQELDEIWDELVMFKKSRMWGIVVSFMQQLYSEAAEAALQAKDMSAVIEQRGIAQAVKQITNFDDYIPVLAKLKKEKTNDSN